MDTRTSSKIAHPAASPGVRIVRVEADRDGQRIDNFLMGQLKGVPKSLVYRVLRTGQVRINGKRAKPDTRVGEGDEVRIPPVRLPEPAEVGKPTRTQLERIERAIIFEDRNFLVIDKPSGVASHGGSGISFGAIELLRAARPNETLELAHRLDRDTSGVMVVARKRSALIALHGLIRDDETTKQYLTLLEGKPAQSAFEVDAPLLKSVLQGGERMVRVDETGKPSITRYRIVDSFAMASLAEITLLTGRTHQIRVHSQYIGHPIAGDEKYGSSGFNLLMREFGLRRLFLHAARFEFALGDHTYSFSASLPTELSATLDALSSDR
jgi:23S rRNA pseudouridine955/2504/2580 synthase